MPVDTTTDGRRTPRFDGTRDDIREAAKDDVRAVWNDAKQSARSKLSEQQRSAASGIGDLAAALRTAADQLEGERHGGVARLAQSAAGGLERVSRTLRHKDVDALMHDAEAYARRQPLAFFATAVAAGFLAVRFVKSSDRGRVDDDEQRTAQARWDRESFREPARPRSDGRSGDQPWTAEPIAAGERPIAPGPSTPGRPI